MAESDEVNVAQLLPPGFEIVPRLLALVRDPDTSNDEIVNVIRVDPGLTADVLHVCNSVAFGGAYRIETLAMAVNRLGLRELYRVALQAVTSVAFRRMQEIGFPVSGFWEHSLCTAVAGQVLAFRSPMQLDPEVAFTAGLLHDLGKLVLWQEFGSDYNPFLFAGRDRNRPRVELEQEQFGLDHAAVGGRLLSEWNLSEDISRAVAFHHSCDSGRPTPLSALVCLANELAHGIDERKGEGPIAASARLVRILEIEPESIPELPAEIKFRLTREKKRSLGSSR